MGTEGKLRCKLSLALLVVIASGCKGHNDTDRDVDTDMPQDTGEEVSDVTEMVGDGTDTHDVGPMDTIQEDVALADEGDIFSDADGEDAVDVADATGEDGTDVVVDDGGDIDADPGGEDVLDDMDVSEEDAGSTVTVIFEVDATGTVIDLDTYVTLTNPPPPGGSGTLSIVGSTDALGNWVPNLVWMADDGVYPDTSASDGLWTLAVELEAGTMLNYKYTCGFPADEGSWVGTEEYPLTNRGLTVPADGTSRIRVHEVFADRPSPSGTQGSLTVITVEE